MDALALSLFAARLDAVCDEMGAVLRQAAFSPNIRDRLDFSCAVFDASGRLCAQAAHIPVHLGSMAFAMGGVVGKREWRQGEMIVLNDPFLGGTHLPDVTIIAPLFAEHELLGFVANRAHHADIGAATPGSMPVSRRLEEEGMVIAPTLLVRDNRIIDEVMDGFSRATRSGGTIAGDFSAQVSANRTGLGRLEALVGRYGNAGFVSALAALDVYAARLAEEALARIPIGEYAFTDVLDDDGCGHEDLPVRVTLRVGTDGIDVDFAGTAAQTEGNVNCPLSVAAAAVYYCFRCLMPPQTPAAAGSFSRIHLKAEPGSLVNARAPAAVAAGNVETSSRIVDAVLGALAKALPAQIPAASQGTMNNLAMGGHGERAWDYYETLGGGMGAGPEHDGLAAVQSHMTNTLNTPIEVLEMNYPLRVRRYAVRSGSGGTGRHRGGDGLVREYEFLAPATVTLLTERRRHRPWGLADGNAGAPGRNLLDGKPLPPKISLDVEAGVRLAVETPGGGGWGAGTV